jgi:hypothetical protein
MSFTLDNINRVNRNSAEQNELWKAIDEDIEKCINVHEAMSLNAATCAVLNRAEYSLTQKDYINLLLGCGCCDRHAKGILPMGETHVNSFNMSEPTTQTAEGKPCDCRCRSIARFNIRNSVEQ